MSTFRRSSRSGVVENGVGPPVAVPVPVDSFSLWGTTAVPDCRSVDVTPAEVVGGAMGPQSKPMMMVDAVDLFTGKKFFALHPAAGCAAGWAGKSYSGLRSHKGLGVRRGPRLRRVRRGATPSAGCACGKTR